MVQKILTYILEFLKFVARKILLFDLLAALVVGASCLVWGPLSATTFSERLIWSGIGLGLVAGFLVFGQTTGGRDFGVPGQFIRGAHVQNIIDFNIEVRQNIETKMGIFPRIFVIGLLLFCLGALVNVLFP